MVLGIFFFVLVCMLIQINTLTWYFRDGERLDFYGLCDLLLNSFDLEKLYYLFDD